MLKPQGVLSIENHRIHIEIGEVVNEATQNAL